MVEGKFLPMLCWIFILGGLLMMMGQHDRSEALFYYFRLEDQVPETHLLRLIEKRRPTPRTGTGSFCNGWPSEKSLRTCGRGRVLSARTAPSMDRSVSPISRKATVIAVRRENNSTTLA